MHLVCITGLLPDEVCDHYKRCISMCVLKSFVVFLWGSRFFSSITPGELPELQAEGRNLIRRGMELQMVREVLDRPNGHGVCCYIRITVSCSLSKFYAGPT